MIFTLTGITGVGKSYFKKYIQEELQLKNVTIVTTREKRNGETEGIDKVFVTEDKFLKMKQKEEIVASFSFLGNQYAYYKEDLDNIDENALLEVHYEAIPDFQKVAKEVYSIYLIPERFELASQELGKRNLSKKAKIERLEEMKEQFQKFKAEKKIRQQYQSIIYNDYTEKTKEELLHIVKKEIEAKTIKCRIE